MSGMRKVKSVSMTYETAQSFTIVFGPSDGILLGEQVTIYRDGTLDYDIKEIGFEGSILSSKIDF